MPTRPPLSDCEIHRELWFKDGNITIQARNAVCKVHKGVLAMHSSVFRDLFDGDIEITSEYDQLWYSPEGDLLFFDDTHVCVFTFIAGIYDASSLPGPTVRTDLKCILGAIWYSYVFKHNNVFRLALRHFHAAFPDTLEEWDTVQIDKIFDNKPFEIADYLSLACFFSDDYYGLNIPWIYPQILHKLFSYGIRKVRSLPEWKSELSADFREELLYRYTRYDILRRIAFEFMVSLPSSLCESAPTCRRALEGWHSSSLIWFDLDVLDVLQDCRSLKYFSSLCDMCRTRCKERYANSRHALWKYLPTMSLKDSKMKWDELREMKRRSPIIPPSCDDSEFLKKIFRRKGGKETATTANVMSAMDGRD